MWRKMSTYLLYLFIYKYNAQRLKGKNREVYLKKLFVLCEFCIDNMSYSEMNLSGNEHPSPP